jgi:UDP-2-acetamido-3-amino-2,3-dideoxy-glucuronate N-acetyltransferase
MYPGRMAATPVDVHPSAIVDAAANVGSGTRIWHFSHVMTGAVVGCDCMIGQGCFIAGGAVVGNRVRIQNHVNVFDGVVLEDDVFCGPGVVFTNVVRPRANVPKKSEYRSTLVKRGATLGANATLLPGITVGEYAFVGAGATVSRDVGAFSLVAGVPAVPIGWVSRHGERLDFDDSGRARCPVTGEVYALVEGRVKPMDAAGS